MKQVTRFLFIVLLFFLANFVLAQTVIAGLPPTVLDPSSEVILMVTPEKVQIGGNAMISWRAPGSAFCLLATIEPNANFHGRFSNNQNFLLTGITDTTFVFLSCVGAEGEMIRSEKVILVY